MNSVPKELVYDICTSLDLISLNRFAQTNSRIYQICKPQLQTWQNKKKFESSLASLSRFPTYATPEDDDEQQEWEDYFCEVYLKDYENKQDLLTLISRRYELPRPTFYKLNRLGFFEWSSYYDQEIADFVLKYFVLIMLSILRVDVEKRFLTNTERISIENNIYLN